MTNAVTALGRRPPRQRFSSTDSVYLPSTNAGVAHGGMPRQINRVELNHRTVPGRGGLCGLSPWGIGSPQAAVCSHYGAVGVGMKPGLSRCRALAQCQFDAWRGDRADQGVRAGLLAQPHPARRVCRAVACEKCSADRLTAVPSAAPWQRAHAQGPADGAGRSGWWPRAAARGTVGRCGLRCVPRGP